MEQRCHHVRGLRARGKSKAVRVAILKDIWRVGLVRAPMDRLLAPGALDAQHVIWLPEAGSLRFEADPFGLWRDGKLFVFIETYDYRVRVGAIEVLTFDADLRLIARQPALNEPWHLSYPFLVETDGETFMLPEAHRSGRLTLYRARDFPTVWQPHGVIELDQIPIDATPVFHEGLWWLFYTPATTRADKVSALHVAFAPRLTGPWTPHPGNPVRYDASSSRPGGTPLVIDGIVVLPVQDCRHTYGGAMRLLRIAVLTPDSFDAEAGEAIDAPASFDAYTAGFHTLSSAGPVTLLDAKRRHVSARTLALDAGRQLRKLAVRMG
jgi:hypothetical protein